MTVSEAIGLLDSYRPNLYSESDKVKWLSMLDEIVFLEIFKTHHIPDHEEDEFPEYRIPSPDDPDYDQKYADLMATTLIVPEPYAEDVYINYLESRVDKENAEIAKYNIDVSLFNQGYMAFADFMNRKYRPVRKVPFIRL